MGQTEKPPEIARRAISDFVNNCWHDVVSGLSEEEYGHHREGLARQLEEAPKNLWEVMQRDWTHIEERTFDFNTRIRQAQYLRSLSHGAFESFVLRHVKPATRLAVL